VASLKPELRGSLAQALYLDEAAIDDDSSFVDLGLDSIVGVEWVKTINKTYGLDISATRVYDYANLHALAGFVHEELAKLPPDRIPQLVAARAAAPVANVPVAMAAPMRASVPLPTFTPAVPFALDALRRRSRSLPVATGAASAQPSHGAGRVAEKIAIVGMSGRYPGADNLERFWRNLVEGRNSIREIPPSRWDVSAWYDPTPGKPGKVYCKWLGMLDGAEEFDPMFFQISPSEAEVMDPQHRLFMQESYRAFQDAGYSSAALSNRKCGVYLGIMSSEYSLLLAKGNPLNVETTGNSFAIGAARIAYHLNLKGPAIPIDTACSSSLVAIHLACQALLNHEIDMGLAGGVSLYLIPESYLGMCRAGMLARDGQCKTFDNRADGFVPGEGVGTVVLKRLSDAERDGDEIYGVIIGSGINQDGKTNGITAPSVNSQIDLLRDVYRRYDIDASTIDYVETHGTGTKLGDPIELEALSTVFKEHGGKRNACALGAVKTNLGHTSGAAGVAGVHKVLLSLRNGALAPNVNLQQENALFDFGASPFHVSRDTREWMPAPGRKRRAAVSAFGFSGTNAHVVIEEYVPTLRQAPARPQACVVPLSARTAEQLRTMAQELLAFLECAEAGIDLHDLAYTLQVGRDPMRERAAWVAGTIADLQSQLRDFLADRPGGLRGTVARSQDTTIPTEEAAALLRREGAVQSAALAALWVEGAEIDWAACHLDAQPRRLHRVPGYPFAKERYWPQPLPTVAAPTAALPDVLRAGMARRRAARAAGRIRRRRRPADPRHRRSVVRTDPCAAAYRLAPQGDRAGTSGRGRLRPGNPGSFRARRIAAGAVRVAAGRAARCGPHAEPRHPQHRRRAPAGGCRRHRRRARAADRRRRAVRTVQGAGGGRCAADALRAGVVLPCRRWREPRGLRSPGRVLPFARAGEQPLSPTPITRIAPSTRSRPSSRNCRRRRGTRSRCVVARATVPARSVASGRWPNRCWQRRRPATFR
jgi:acyl transferase domain-containing protein/acyl carrier protein